RLDFADLLQEFFLVEGLPRPLQDLRRDFLAGERFRLIGRTRHHRRLLPGRSRYGRHYTTPEALILYGTPSPTCSRVTGCRPTPTPTMLPPNRRHDTTALSKSARCSASPTRASSFSSGRMTTSTPRTSPSCQSLRRDWGCVLWHSTHVRFMTRAWA